MRILVDRLSDAPTDFRFEADSSWWRTHMRPGPGMPDGLDEPLQVGVRAHTMGEDLYFEGQLEGDLALECSRCLARYRHPLHEPFRLVLEPSGVRVPADPEGARLELQRAFQVDRRRRDVLEDHLEERLEVLA